MKNQSNYNKKKIMLIKNMNNLKNNRKAKKVNYLKKLMSQKKIDYYFKINFIKLNIN